MKQQRRWSWRSPRVGVGVVILSLPGLPAVALEGPGVAQATGLAQTHGLAKNQWLSRPVSDHPSLTELPQGQALKPLPGAMARPSVERHGPDFSPAMAQGIDPASSAEGAIDLDAEAVPLPEEIDSTAESLEAIPNTPQDIPLIPGLDTPTVLPEQDPTAPLPGGQPAFELEGPVDSALPPEGEDDFDQDPTLEEIFPEAGMEDSEGEGEGGAGAGGDNGDRPTAAEEEDFEGDPDLGVLRLRERPLATRNTRTAIPVYLVSNSSYTGNDNTLAGDDPVDDRFFRSSLALIVSPRLSRRTVLIGSVQGSLNRYNELSRVDYNELSFQASLRQVLLPRVYGDIGWTNRNLYLDREGDRFLKEHAAFVSLTRRDPLNGKTTLTSFYNLRAGFADPESSSRLRNTLGTSLRYDITPRWQTALTGRLTLTNFTQQERQDFYGQALAQVSYKLSNNTRVSLFGSLVRGNSSNRRVDFDSSTLGVSFNATLQLF